MKQRSVLLCTVLRSSPTGQYSKKIESNRFLSMGKKNIMEFIYIVVENGEPYPKAYKTYETAITAVLANHQEEIQRQIDECGLPICSEILMTEDKSGKTYSYVEKGIHIYVYKLPVIS